MFCVVDFVCFIVVFDYCVNCMFGVEWCCLLNLGCWGNSVDLFWFLLLFDLSLWWG